MKEETLKTASEQVVDNASSDVNQNPAELQGSITPDSNCNTLSNPTTPVPLDKCLAGKYIAGTKAGTISSNPNLEEWDGEPLKEDVVYHRNKMLGLPECTIMENRDAQKRAKDWRKVCRENAMVNPAVYVNAKIAKEAGMTPAIYNKTTKDWWIVPDDLLKSYYLIMDGNGRLTGHDLDLEEAMSSTDYKPFDFPFVYKHFDDPEAFYTQYLSVNLDVKKTTRSELLQYTSCRNTGSILKSYYALQNDGFVAKAASYYIIGRELTKSDIKKASEGLDINVDQEVVDCMRDLLETYKSVFSAAASQKVLKGVSLSRWTCDTLNNAADKKAMKDKIIAKFSNMSPQLLSKLQDAKGVKGDRTKTTEIILIGIFNEILNS